MEKTRKMRAVKDPVVKIVQEHFTNSHTHMQVKKGWHLGKYARQLLKRPIFDLKEHWWHHEAEKHLNNIKKGKIVKVGGEVRTSQLYALAATYANLTHLINAHSIMHYNQREKADKKLSGSILERIKNRRTRKKEVARTPEGWMEGLVSPTSWDEVDKVREMMHQQKHVLAEMYKLDKRTEKAKDILLQPVGSKAQVLHLLERGEPSFFDKIEVGVDAAAGAATTVETFVGIPAIMTLNPIIIGGWLLTLPAEFGASLAVRGLNKIELRSLKKDLKDRPDYKPLYKHLQELNKWISDKTKRFDIKKFKEALNSNPETW